MSSRPIRARIARAASWVVAVGTAITGLFLLLTRTVVLWERSPEGAEYASEANPIDVTGIGLALLCTGLLTIIVVLVCEGYLSQRRAPVPERERFVPSSADSAQAR